MSDAQKPGPYCLYCYAHLPRFEQASQVCACCGKVNLKVDQSIFWTRERDMREYELIAKTLIVLVFGWFSWTLLTGFEGGTGTKGSGFIVGGVILPAWVLWETASRLTHRTGILDLRIIWTVLPGSIGGAAIVLVLGTSMVFRREPSPEFFGALVAFTVVISTLGLIGWFGSTAFHRWRDRHIIRGREHAEQAS